MKSENYSSFCGNAYKKSVKIQFLQFESWKISDHISNNNQFSNKIQSYRLKFTFSNPGLCLGLYETELVIEFQ